MVGDINLESAEPTAAEIDGAAMALNIADREAVDTAMNGTVAALGSLGIHVNNAGLLGACG